MFFMPLCALIKWYSVNMIFKIFEARNFILYTTWKHAVYNKLPKIWWLLWAFYEWNAHQETYDSMAYGYKSVHTENQLLSWNLLIKSGSIRYFYAPRCVFKVSRPSKHDFHNHYSKSFHLIYHMPILILQSISSKVIMGVSQVPRPPKNYGSIGYGQRSAHTKKSAF